MNIVYRVNRVRLLMSPKGVTHSPNLPYSKGIGSLEAAIPVVKVVYTGINRGKSAMVV